MEYKSKTKKRKSLPNVFSKEKLVRLFNVIDDIRLMIACFTAFVCGLRISEICNLRIADVNLEEKKIKVVQGKGKKDRTIYLVDDRYIPIFKKWIRMNKKKEYFIPSNQDLNNHISTTNLSAIYIKALEKAGLLIPSHKDQLGRQQHQYKFHTLRHSYCTYLIKKGLPIPYVQKLMGHNDIETTMKYTHIVDVDMRDKIDEVFNNKQKQIEMPQINQVQPLQQNQLTQEKKQNPLEILKVRLALGEIDLRTFKQLVNEIIPKPSYIG